MCSYLVKTAATQNQNQNPYLLLLLHEDFIEPSLQYVYDYAICSQAITLYQKLMLNFATPYHASFAVMKINTLR